MILAGCLWVMGSEGMAQEGSLTLRARSRVAPAAEGGVWGVTERTLAWDPRRTAMVVCDMWDRHWCEGATRRVAEMAPRMNEVLKAARERGVFIIHCPSDTMPFYEGTPQRERAKAAPKAPQGPRGWQSLDPRREPPLPIDDSDGGCDDSPQCRQHGPWKRQIAALEIAEEDAITDSEEAYNLMKARGITNVVVLGVHLNMCVLGRPFSIRNMVLHGQNVVFVRDLTDTMYNSRMPPYVSHFAGTDLVTEHIEKYWCPSVTSADFVGGEPFRFAADVRPKVVFLIGEDEYRTWETLPEFAERELRWRGYEVRVIQADADNKHRFPGLEEALTDADLLVVSVRRRALTEAQLGAIRTHLVRGKPLVGIRTASHAFAPRGADAALGAAWPDFDPEVLGGNYQGHHGSGPRVVIRPSGTDPDGLLTGVRTEGFTSAGSLYRVRPLGSAAVPVLIGSIPDKPEEPVAWTHRFGARQARVFYTSLGHPEDFEAPAFRRLLLNGILWAMARPIPPAAVNRAEIEREYRDRWRAMVVPGTWDEHSESRLSGYDGMAWYRCLVRPPAEWAGRDWELLVESVDNAHEAYVDGVKVGGAGRLPPDYASGLSAQSQYPIAGANRRPGDWHLVALRVYDHDGRGGFKGRAPALRAGDRVILLAGEWQFRLGDDPAWARLQEGESLGNHLFHQMTSLEMYERGGIPEKLVPTAKPLTPAESATQFTVADGLEMDLVLSEPDIAQPLQVSFDARGRLWLVEYRQYPAPAGLKLVSHDQFWRAVYDQVPRPPPNHFPGKDRISIHEDTDGDGRYDQHRVFVEGLNIATAIAHGRGGVWVLNPPYLLFYPDRDGDDLPDGDPQVHLEGFGLEDTHSVVNSLRWGPDGWLYAAQGSTVSARVRRPGSAGPPVHSLGQNIWRYHPETGRYEVFAEGGGNAFGVEIDDVGRIFSGHNGGNTRGFHYVQGGYLQKGFQKHGDLSNPYAFGYYPQMGHPDVERFTHTFVVYGGGALGAEHGGRLFGIEPLQGRVVMSEMLAEGSTFRTRDVGYAVTSADPWFKPVDIKHGPDGALYVADWYDFQVNHWRNYQGNMDASNGRVYRLRARGDRPARPEDLGRLSSLELVERLESPNRWVRQTALRLLADRRDPSAAAPLRRRMETGTGQGALEALWALNACGGFGVDVARTGLGHANPHVREWTVRLLGDGGRLPEGLVSEVESLAARETGPEVRLQLAATARRLPADQAMTLVKALLAQAGDEGDARFPLMLWWAVEAHAGAGRTALLPLLNAGLWEHPMVVGHLLERWMRRYAAAGGPEDLAVCTELLRQAPTDAARARLVAGFELAFRDRSLAGIPSSLLEALVRAGGGSLALQMRMGREGALERAIAAAGTESENSATRIQILQALGEMKERRGLPVLLAASRTGAENVRVAALAALRAFDRPEVGEAALAVLAESGPGAVRTAALTLLASRASWSARLLAAIERGDVAKELVNSEVARQLRQHGDAEMAARLERIWPVTAASGPALATERVASLARIVRSGSGDPYQGKRLFTANCGACHKLFSAGGEIGPDLTPFRRDDVDSVLLSIVNPSAEVREGYENFQIETRDDRSISGFLVRQDERVVVIRGLDGQDVVVGRDEILEFRPAGLSLMPEGLLDGLADQEIRDLFAYLRSSQPLAN